MADKFSLKTIAIAATLDTKGKEVNYIKHYIESKGHNALVIDIGILGEIKTTENISREEVAIAGGIPLPKLIQEQKKAGCLKVMMNGAAKIVEKLYKKERINGIISIGGAQGTAMGTYIMRSLPLGIPKVMVSTIACGNTTFGPYVGTKDIMMMHSVADILGINFVLEKTLRQASGAIVGMVESLDDVAKENNKPKIALTMIGITTPCGMRLRDALEENGYEVIVFHGNGVGADIIDELTGEGKLQGVFDLSPNDITGYLFEGLMKASPNRFENVYSSGIPVLAVPGGMSIIVKGPVETLDKKYLKQKYVVHNPNFSHVRITGEEMFKAGKYFAQKLNTCTGKAEIIIPLKGFSQLNKKGEALFDEESNKSLVDGIMSNIDKRIEIKKVNAHINDKEFSDILITEFFKIFESSIN